MNRVTYFLLVIACLSISSAEVLAKSSSSYTYFDISPAIDVTHNPIVLNLLPNDSNEIILMGMQDDKRVIAVYHKPEKAGDYQLYSLYPLTKAIMAYDVFESESGDKQLYFMSHEGIHYFDAQDTKNALPLIVEAQSIYIQKEASHIVNRKFTRDLNGDGQADFYLQGYRQLITALSNNNQFIIQNINLLPQFTMFTRSIEVHQRDLFFADFNQDGMEDIAWLSAGSIDFHPQKDDGFTGSPQTLRLNPEFSDTNWWDMRQADGSQLDQSKLHHRKIEKIDDLNGDDIPDLLVRFAQSNGVFDRTNDYEVFMGEMENNNLTYPSTPDTAIQSEGTLTGLTIVDIDQNDQKEILIAGFDIGVSQIIGALINGAIDQDVYLYQQDKDGKFGRKPAVSKEVEMSFSLSSGKTGIPIVKLEDMNGDTRQDLLLSNGDSSLSFYKGQDGKRPFAKRKLKIKTAVPKDGEACEIIDVDQNGTHEILLRFSEEDEDLDNTIRIITLT